MWTSYVVLVLLVFVSQFGVIFNDTAIKRLSQDVNPLRYTLRIDTRTIPNSKISDFLGIALIEVNVSKPVDKIVLHAENLSLRNAIYLDPHHPVQDDVAESSVWSDVNEIFSKVLESGKIGNISRQDDLLFMRKKDNQLFESGIHVLYFDYVGSINSADRGGFFKDFVITSKKPKTKDWFVSTVFETSDARKAFPCFDEPGFKSHFRIIISRHKNFTALSNMPSARVEAMNPRDGWMWEYFHESPPISTFLVAFYVGRFGYLESENGMKLWSASTNNTSIRWILENGDATFKELQLILGPNPLPKQDLLAVPHFTKGLAVENWGIPSFRQNVLLVGNSRRSRYYALEILTHELAHNWLGNLVTQNWWDEVWFSEGFTCYFTSTVLEKVIPERKIKNWDIARYHEETRLIDSEISTRALAQPIIYKEEMNVGHLNYCKGFLIVRFINLTIGGDKTLEKAVSQYINNNQFGLFSEEELFNTIETISTEERNLSTPVPLQELVKPWLRLPGYPLIRVHQESNGTIIISQERYIQKLSVLSILNQLGKSIEDNEGQWWIPITIITGQSNSSSYKFVTPQYWLQPGKKLIINDLNIDNSSWLLINPDVPVPSAVQYDDWNLEKLDDLNYANLPDLMLMQILLDVTTFASDGVIPLPVAFRVVEQIFNNTNSYYIWRAGLKRYQKDYMLLQNEKARDYFKEHIQKIVAPQYMKLKLTYTDDESYESELLRPMVAQTACTVELNECLKDATFLFKLIMFNETLNTDLEVREDVKSIVYCTGVETGGQKEWVHLWEKLKSENDLIERKMLLEGLACTKNTRQIKRFLMSSINTSSSLEFKSKKERHLVLKSVLRNPVATDVALDFIADHQKEIQKAYSRTGKRYNWSKLVNAILPFVNNEQQIAKLQEISANLRSNGSANDVLNSARWVIQWKLSTTKLVMDSLT